MRSICVPIRVPLLLEHIPGTRSCNTRNKRAIIGNYRDFPSNNLASLHIIVFYYRKSQSYGEAFGICEKKNIFYAQVKSRMYNIARYFSKTLTV